jgi:hypothetical protein
MNVRIGSEPNPDCGARFMPRLLALRAALLLDK